MDSFEQELKAGFLDEASQLLSDAEQCFLDLESHRDSPESATTIERLFRLAHNLKGSAGAVGFTHFMEFTHKLESFLLKVKNKELPVTSDIVSVLLKCNDRLTYMVDKLKGDLETTFDNSDLVSVMTEAAANASADGPAVAAASAPAGLDASGVPDAALAQLTQAQLPAEEPPAVEAEPSIVAEAVIIPDVAADSVPDASAFGPETPEALAATTQAALHQAEPADVSAPAVAPPAPVAAPAPAASHEAPKPDESIRVSLARLDKLMNNVGELVILETVLSQHRAEIPSPLLQKTITQLEKITSEIQDISMSLRMVPLKQTFQKMQRIVRDVSKMLSKDVALTITGEDTELDKTVLEQVGDPLVHLIRNAVDHGLEATADRVTRGKPAQGHIGISAYHSGESIVIEVKDDGNGLDPKRLTAKAIEKGILPPGTVLPDQEAYQLIFAAGFSTKAEVTDISGRGVGMDVVKKNIEALQGEIELETQLGSGTTFRIVLPLTLAIIDGMVVRVGEERYVVPIAQIHESIQPDVKDISKVGEVGELLNLRGEAMAMFRLSKLLGRTVPVKTASECIAMVVRDNKGGSFSLLVDEITGQQQVVIKRLGEELQGVPGISGGAILGDGKAALIIDVNEIVQFYRQHKTRPSLRLAS